MVIYYDNRIAMLQFGVEQLKRTLCTINEHTLFRFFTDYTGLEEGPVITVSFAAQRFTLKAKPELKPEGFELLVSGEHIHVLGADATGAMYGLFELAEDIMLGGIDSVKSKRREPFLRKRGVKFNLPYEPYDNGDPMTLNAETCLDTEFWSRFIDFLALNRYNLLSLWSEHPFHMMFRLEKYPEACPYDDVFLERCKALFRFIIDRCAMRGIVVYLITWNIRITPFVAEALGLPKELGDMSQQYDVLYDRANKIPNSSKSLYPVRQHQPVIKDYFRECIRTLLLTYGGLGGIGTNCAEEMSGSAQERQEWVEETYLEALLESGRDIPFIMRTNMGNGKLASVFLEKCPASENYISWKYSNAHMYSCSRPKFDELWGAWEDVDLSKQRVLFTVRNDDVHTLRQAGFEYLSDYIRGMGRDYVEGFYWGADGYLWGIDFQTSPHYLKNWKYDFEKHWNQFWLLGRLSYHPDEDRDRYTAAFIRDYGPWGEKLCELLETASAIIPAVNRLFWLNYDTQWHPESLLSVDGFKSVIDFVDGTAMPGSGTVSISEFAEAEKNGDAISGESPIDIINILHHASATLEKGLRELECVIPAYCVCDKIRSILVDLHCWRHLGEYYHLKFKAALELARLRSGTPADDAAVILKKAVEQYKELSDCWSQLYLPYKMARVKYTFGYPLYLDEARRDIPLARSFIKNYS